MYLRLLLLTVFAATAAACNGDRVQDTAEVDPRPTAEALDPEADPASTGHALGDTVAATLDEFFIDIPIEIPAGRTVFRVHNAGERQHSFAVEVEGQRVAEVGPLDPGDEAVVEADLPADADVVVLCPIAGHAPEGMRMQLRVHDPEMR